MDSIEKLKLKNNEILIQLISTHISFIIESNFDFNYQQKHNKIAVKAVNPTIFGSNLTQEGICSVHQLIEFITSDKNIIREGIFRKSGSSSRQLVLQNLISSGITVDFEANRFSVDDCCSVLKRFVSELPEPLLTESYFQLFNRISELSPNSKKLTAIQLILLLIPVPNRQLLKELLVLFEKVVQNSDSNKMSSLSLGTLFAPHLFCPRSYTALQLQQILHSIIQTLIFMIDNSQLVCQPPEQLVIDVEKQLEILEKKKSESTSSLAAVNAAHQFCVREKAPDSDDFTAKQVAELYAYLHSMPNTGTPLKKKWIKRFNRENGKGTPLLKQKKSDSTKKLKTSFGGVLKAGQQLFFGNTSDETAKQNKLNKNLMKDSILNLSSDEKEIYKKLTPNVSQNNSKKSFECLKDNDISDQKQENTTPLGLSLGNANKKVRLSVRKVGNREPIVM